MVVFTSINIVCVSGWVGSLGNYALRASLLSASSHYGHVIYRESPLSVAATNTGQRQGE